MRRGAKRAARSLIQEATTAWASISAVGKVAQLTAKHEWLLKAAATSRTVDTGCQTVDSVLEVSRDHDQDLHQHHQHVPPRTNVEKDKRKWIQQNESVSGSHSFDISSVGLGKLMSHTLYLLILLSFCHF